MKLYVDRLKDSPTGYEFEVSDAWRSEAEELVPELRGALAEPIHVALRANRMGQDCTRGHADGRPGPRVQPLPRPLS